MADPLIAYLMLLCGPDPAGRLLEVRARRTGRPGMSQTFLPAVDVHAAADLIRSAAAGGDTYVGVLLRDRPQGGHNAVTRSHLLWAEIDASDAADRLGDAPAPPTAVVSSGTAGHLHAYWLLSSQVNAAEVAQLNRKLAAAVSGDLASVDCARILRPPGTLNHKHHPAALTRLELLNPSRRYDPGQLTAGLSDPRPTPAYGPSRPRPRPSRRSGAAQPWWRRLDQQLRDIPAETYLPRLAGEQLNREGKIHCPFHADGTERTASLQIYPPYEWACFGCQRGGSIYDFASHLWGIPTKGSAFLQLRDRLAETFNISPGERPEVRTRQPVRTGQNH